MSGPENWNWPGPLHSGADAGQSGPDIVTPDQKSDFIKELRRKTFIMIPLGLFVIILTLHLWTFSFPVEKFLFLLVGVSLSYLMARDVYDSNVALMERRTGLSTAAAVKTKITIRRSVFFLLTVAIVGMLIEILLPGWANGNALLPMMWGFWLGAFLISPIFADWHIIRRLEAELEKASWPNTQPDVEVAK